MRIIDEKDQRFGEEVSIPMNLRTAGERAGDIEGNIYLGGKNRSLGLPITNGQPALKALGSKAKTKPPTVLTAGMPFNKEGHTGPERLSFLRYVPEEGEEGVASGEPSSSGINKEDEEARKGKKRKAAGGGGGNGGSDAGYSEDPAH